MRQLVRAFRLPRCSLRRGRQYSPHIKPLDVSTGAALRTDWEIIIPIDCRTSQAIGVVVGQSECGPVRCQQRYSIPSPVERCPGDHERSHAHVVAESVHARSGGDFHGDDFVADRHADGAGDFHVRKHPARDSVNSARRKGVFQHLRHGRSLAQSKVT